MKILSFKCPECHAILKVEDEIRSVTFCQYCGAKIILDDESQTIVHREIDDARIKEAEAYERVKMAELNAENKKNMLEAISDFFSLALPIGFLIILALLGYDLTEF